MAHGSEVEVLEDEAAGRLLLAEADVSLTLESESLADEAIAPPASRTAASPTGTRMTGLSSPRRRLWLGVLAVFGPGLIVMLADTDAGSVVTAAQSGTQFGYRLILPELLLIPILFIVQEITVRLGVLTQEGHGALVRRYFGKRWALLSAGTLFIACVGALITEFAGIAGAGELAGIPDWVSVPLAAAALSFLFTAGRYRRVEMVGIVLGLLELAFIPAALLAHPHGGQLAHGLSHSLVSQHAYLMLVAANVGAVIMPWMIFYQQGAVIDKGITRKHLRMAQADTALGSVLTQVVMIAIVVATAATIGRTKPGAALTSIGQIATALVPFLGHTYARLLFGLGMLGAAVVAALVVSVAGAWGLCEARGWCHSFNAGVRTAWRFYLLSAGALIVSAGAVVVAPNLVNLSVDVQVMNAALLPIVLGFLLLLERRALAPADRMHGLHKWLAWVLAAAVIGVGIYAVLGAFALV
ncbi:MAG: NRAMP family divalent metal transporter [Thermoleophilia bacterium]